MLEGKFDACGCVCLLCYSTFMALVYVVLCVYVKMGMGAKGVGECLYLMVF